MTALQRRSVVHLLAPITELHLGDCIGADTEAYADAKVLGLRLIGHPPIAIERRSFLHYDLEYAPRPFLARNHEIVDEAPDGLIAAPFGMVEELRAGTWATVRYARKVGRRLWLVLPDGSVKIERG